MNKIIYQEDRNSRSSKKKESLTQRTATLKLFGQRKTKEKS